MAETKTKKTDAQNHLVNSRGVHEITSEPVYRSVGSEVFFLTLTVSIVLLTFDAQYCCLGIKMSMLSVEILLLPDKLLACVILENGC